MLKNKITNELIGIEYNGVFIHSYENGYVSGYHLNKTCKTEELNIKLIHIFSCDWIFNKTFVMSIIGQHIFNAYHFTSPIIRLDRSLFNLAVKIDGYKLKYVEPPTQIKLKKSKQEFYTTENCGYLVYEKI